LPQRRGEGRAFGEHDPVTGALRTDLGAVAATSAAGEGTVWSLRAGSDPNANVVRFGAGRGVGEHVDDETDVVLVGVAGSGFVEADGREHALGVGELVFVPRGARRSTRDASEGFAYLTVHRRRGPIRIRTRVERESTYG